MVAETSQANISSSRPTAQRDPLVVVVGPTAVGKTALSLELAEAVDGEIISADSRLVYRGLDLGTAKPTAAELQRVPHHLIDILDPDETLTLAEYQGRACAAITAIHHRGRVPILVGGSGQYVRAVMEGWHIPEVSPSHALRSQLEQFAAEHGAVNLHSRLAELDPAAASRIHPRNVRRVVRALEVVLVTGQRISDVQTKSPPPYRILQLGLTRPRPALYARIDARIERMLAAGLVEEVRRLAATWRADSLHRWDLPALTALGYRQIGLFLQETITLQEAVNLIRRETRRFARQQGTWFRLDDPDIEWYDLDKTDLEQITGFALRWLTQGVI